MHAVHGDLDTAYVTSVIAIVCVTIICKVFVFGAQLPIMTDYLECNLDGW